MSCLGILESSGKPNIEALDLAKLVSNSIDHQDRPSTSPTRLLHRETILRSPI